MIEGKIRMDPHSTSERLTSVNQTCAPTNLDRNGSHDHSTVLGTTMGPLHALLVVDIDNAHRKADTHKLSKLTANACA